MQTMRRLTVFVALIATDAACDAALPLLPRPQEVEELDGDFALADANIAVYPPGDSDLRFAAKMAKEELGLSDQEIRPTNVLVGLPSESAKFARVCDEAGLVPDEALGDQGYLLLATPERVIISANAPAGAFYGVQTLLQLAEIGSGRKIPCVRIRDWPVLEWRGVLTDQSRQAVPKVETYKRMIRELSRHKINFISMHLEHTFVVEKHPIISDGTGALTAADVGEICDYARKYHCLFFPSFEAFSHQHHIFKHEEYAHLAESPGGSSFSPVQDGTYELLEDIFDEMVPAFTGTDFFNAGCDEVGDLGTGQSKELAEEIGKDALYARHMNRVHDMLTSRGKRMMMWGDMLLHHPEAIEMVPKDTIIMDWHYGPQHDYPSIKQFRDAGFEVFVIPALSSWMRLFPDYELALENIEWLIRRGREGGAIGSMTCNWGDNGNENMIAYSYYGWLFAGECSWGAQPEEIDRDAFDRAFCRQFFGTRSTGPAKATHLLSQANHALGGDAYFNWRFFHDDPFVGALRASWPRQKRVDQLTALLAEADEELWGRVDRNRDVWDAMWFAKDRAQYVADKARALATAREIYEGSWAKADAWASISDAEDLLFYARSDLSSLRRGFVRQWSRENRPEGNDYNLRRWDAQLAAYDARIDRLWAAEESGDFPAPAEIGLDDPRFKRALKAKRAEVASDAPWPDGAGTKRVPVVISAGARRRVNAPVIVGLTSGGVSVDAKLVLNGDEVVAQSLGDQLAFIIPGVIEAGEESRGELYVDADPATYEPLADAGGNDIIVDVGPYAARLGSEGAHIYEWRRPSRRWAGRTLRCRATRRTSGSSTRCAFVASHSS